MRTSRGKIYGRKTSIHLKTNSKRRKRNPNSVVMFDPILRASPLSIAKANEILRSHKALKAAGKSSWKVVPRDSCEIYKRKRGRSVRRSRFESSDSSNMECSSENKKTRQRHSTKSAPSKKGKSARKKQKKRSSSRKSQSISSYSETCSSYTSTEMDYE